MTRVCRKCGASRHSSVLQCDCGYDFRELRGYCIAILYAPADEPYMLQLSRHLAPLVREGIDAWHPGDIAPGSDRSAEIDSHILAADIIIVLVSADYIAMDEFYNRELYDALITGTKGIVPAVLRPCDWRSTPLGILGDRWTGEEIVISETAVPDTAWSDLIDRVRHLLGKDPTFVSWYRTHPVEELQRAERIKPSQRALLEKATKQGLQPIHLNEFNTIGRSDKNSITLIHPSVSRHHCIISTKTRVGGSGNGYGYFLHDLNSSHGTAINDNPVSRYYGLKHGDQIRVGDIEMRFLLVG
ncbi:FHA domain-containing protein [Sorangium sp. So ce119]|uniref:FHA domain-containing protein n=1 Tax=Sorangium sp. So ce119 TaxID=3133279 RepID=UPI003F638A47